METLLRNKEQLIAYIVSGCKDSKDAKIGIEFENFLFSLPNYEVVPYERIASILNSFNSNKWNKIYENNFVIGLKSNLGNISLEPAGQFEFSSAPLDSINDIRAFIREYFLELMPILETHHIELVSLGLNPKFDTHELPLMPKNRYNFMYSYMPSVGSRGQEMMKQTATYQVNIDYFNEEDLGKKFKVLMAIQPLLGALYSNSAIKKKKIQEQLSYRNYIWLDTDNQRSGILPFVLDGSFSIEKYVDYALQVPMYFVERDKNFINANGISFADFMSGKKRIENITPTLEDFQLHLSTLFPDVRLKTYLETRLTDCPDIAYYCTLPALITGLVYNKDSLDNAYDIINQWSYEEVKTLKNDTITQGLRAMIQNKSVAVLLCDLLEIAYSGLKNRGLNEEVYLAELKDLLKSNTTMAQEKIALLEKSSSFNNFLGSISLKTIKDIKI